MKLFNLYPEGGILVESIYNLLKEVSILVMYFDHLQGSLYSRQRSAIPNKFMNFDQWIITILPSIRRGSNQVSFETLLSQAAKGPHHFSCMKHDESCLTRELCLTWELWLSCINKSVASNDVAKELELRSAQWLSSNVSCHVHRANVL